MDDIHICKHYLRYTFLNLHEGKITHVPVTSRDKITISLLCPRGSIYLLTRCNQNVKKRKKKKGRKLNELIYEPMTNRFANHSSAHFARFLRSVFKASTVNKCSMNQNFIAAPHAAR